MHTTQEHAGVGPDVSDTRERRGGCEACSPDVPHLYRATAFTRLYAALLRDREPETIRVRLCIECAQFVRAGSHEQFSGLAVLGDLVGHIVAFRRAIDDSRDIGTVVRDVPEHNSVVIGAHGKGQFGRFERVIHRSNILYVEPSDASTCVREVCEVCEVRHAS